ncbi:MAG TPA: zinc ribbon domain-containing protein [Pyrinomonadaceae bacterium]|nr:zinc ribbon domain-containing protein [Pyrinomonadaceae bacterium]
MVDEVLTMERCAECDAEVREGTQFCYNCGKSVLLPESEPVTEDIVLDEQAPEKPDDTAELENADKAARRASAALERKRSRVSSKRQTKVVWVEPGPAADRVYLLVCILLFVIAVAVVALTTFLK